MKRRTLATLPILATLVVVLLSCEGGFRGDPVEPSASALELADGRSGGPSEGFYFLPPIAAQPDLSGMEADPWLEPEVVVCSWDGAACTGEAEWRFTRGAERAEDRLRVSEEDGHYHAVWQGSRARGSGLYRIRVELDGVVLGWADVLVGEKKGAKVAGPSAGGDGPSDPVLVPERALPIRFFIAVGVGGMVEQAPITLAPAVDGRVGSGLMEAWAGSLDGVHDGTVVRLTSADAGVALVAADPVAAGSGSVDISVPAGTSDFTFWVHAAGAPGDTISVSASAQRFRSETATGLVEVPTVELTGLSDTTTSLSPADTFQVQVGIRDSAGFHAQAVRTGGLPVEVEVATSEPEVAVLVAGASGSGEMGLMAAPSGPETSVSIQPGSTGSSAELGEGGVALEPQSPGVTTVAARLDAAQGPPQDVVVKGPTIAAADGTVVGAGLQARLECTLDTADHRGTVVRVKSEDPERLLVSADPATAGAASMEMEVVDGVADCGFWVQAVDGAAVGGVGLSISARKFTPTSVEALVVQPGLRVDGLPATTGSFAANSPFRVTVGVFDATRASAQMRSAAAGPLEVTVTSSDAFLAEMVGAAGAGASATAQVAPGAYATPNAPAAAGGVELDPINGGIVTVQATAPGFLSGPQASAAVEIEAPAITVSTGVDGVGRLGSGLMESRTCYLGYNGHGGTEVTVASSDPSLFLVSTAPGQPGVASVTLQVPDGNPACGPFWVHGLDGVAGTGAVVVSATGYDTRNATVTVQPPVFGLEGLASTRASLAGDDEFRVTVGVPQAGVVAQQAVRTGASAVRATVSSSAPAVGTLVTGAGPADAVEVDIASGTSQSPATVWDGGVAFRPEGEGVTTIAVTAPGFAASPTASQDVTVTVPSIDVQVGNAEGRVGSGLQQYKPCYLGATGHGGVVVRVTSADPSVALVSAGQDLPGGATAEIWVPTWSNRCGFYVQGVEGATGSVALTVTARGFSDGSGTAHVEQPTHQIQLLSTTQTAGGSRNPFVVRVGVINALGTALLVQPVRAGGSPLDVLVSSSDPAVGDLVTSAGAAASVTVQVAVGQYGTPAAVGWGGVEFRPRTVGTTTVSSSIAGFVPMAGAERVVTVTP